MINAVALCTLLTTATLAPTDLVDKVDPMIGVRGEGRTGACIPGPCLPNGSIHPSPDTLTPGNGGYLTHQPIVGFSQLHAQGTGGTKSYGNFLLTPMTGDIALIEKDRASDFDDEHARADSYSVRLTQSNITCDITPTAHCALYRFEFPASATSEILLDVARKLDKSAVLDDGRVHIDPKTGHITGGGKFTGNWNPAPYTLYFAADVSRPPEHIGTWLSKELKPDSADAQTKKQPMGAYLRWITTDHEKIEMKIAVSFVSEKRAEEYLAAEIPTWDFDTIRNAAAQGWQHELSAIEITGLPPAEETKFYTALYHTMIQPRNRTGDNPNWSSDQPFFDDYYTLWDSYRTVFPLMAIIRPQFVADNVNAMIDRHAHNGGGGYVGTGFTQGKEMKTGQGGDEVDNVLADACVKKIPGIDWEKAYAMLHDDAETARTPDYRDKGYVAEDTKHNYDWRMHSGSSTLAFAYNDFCVSQVATALGKTEDAKKYLARSHNWQNVWDDSLSDAGFSGFIHARHADGSFTTTPATLGDKTDFYEGSCWVYSYFLPGDVDGMINKMGGPEKFVTRLEYALDHQFIDFTNEPSFDTLWWFDAAHHPDLASKWTNQLKSLYTTDGYPGDEDNGAMSSLYVFLTAGLYPIAGRDLYYLHGPHAEKITFHLPNQKTFTITTQNYSDKNIYIQSATLNNKPLTVPYITHQDITTGSTLNFVMGDNPSTWGH